MAAATSGDVRSSEARPGRSVFGRRILLFGERAGRSSVYQL
ncbi:MAG: hypothetical protein Q8P67_26120 [archaeon]|nr:hypothetical protein [archaeon]